MGKMVYLLIGASDGHELFMTLLRLDASFHDDATCCFPFLLELRLSFDA
jgi:hypothetical protein